MRRHVVTLAMLLQPGPVFAHDAFGDLGPFYSNLLHPFADPAQGLLIVAIAVLLSRQSLATVRPAYAALAFTGAVTILLGNLVAAEAPGLRLTGLLAGALGTAALIGLPLSPVPAILLAVAIAVASGLAIDLPPGTRAVGLAAFGAMIGIALSVLLVWGLVDAAGRRLGPVAGAVAGSWVAAVGIMAAALPPG